MKSCRLFGKVISAPEAKLQAGEIRFCFAIDLVGNVARIISSSAKAAYLSKGENIRVTGEVADVRIALVKANEIEIIGA